MKKTNYRMFSKPGIFLLLTLIAFFLISCAIPGEDKNAVVPPASAEKAGKAKNIIVLIADGCSAEQYTFARWYKGEPLSFDEMLTGGIKTYIADSVVADSAPAATAFATGVRSSDKFISVGPHEKTITGVDIPPEELRYKPLATIMEGAKLLKKATGVVATSRVTHATPAAYIAHVPSRSMEDDIMEQAVYQNMDMVMGGGMRHLLPKDAKGKRPDGENLAEVLKQRGYRIVENRDQMKTVTSGKVFGMFASSHLDAEIDREKQHPEQPALHEMTEKAIEILSQDPDGFFLMVEGSQIDWACHANDPAHLLSDMLAYDKAVKIALDFAKKDGNTLVLAFSDHNTGGFSIGNYSTSETYSQIKVDNLLRPFRNMTVSSSALWAKTAKNKTPATVIRVVKEGWGIDISEDEAKKILDIADKYKDDPNYGFGEVICPRYTYVGWATHGHSGGDVPLYAFGPGKPTGIFDGPGIGKLCARTMGLSLSGLNDRLFADPVKYLDGAVVRIDKTEPANPVVKIEFKGKTAELPINKNILKIGDKTEELEGVVVYAEKKDKAYLPMQAIRLIAGDSSPLPSVRE